MLQTVHNYSLGGHLAGSLPEDEGVKCKHELVMPGDLLKWDEPDGGVGTVTLLGLRRPSFECVNVGSETLSGYVRLNDQPIFGTSQVFWVRAANEAVCAIARLETLTTVRLVALSEVPLPVADCMRRYTRTRLTESQLRFGLAFEVRVEKVVRDQHPMIAV